MSVAEAEKELIIRTLQSCEGNKTKAAQVLGVSLKTLYNRLNEYASEA
jgi:DNA-binding NtrC family response regulator